MTLQPGEAAVLFIRRSDTQPHKYFFAVRRSGSSFEQITHDFQFHAFQGAILELGERSDFDVALNEAIAEIRKLQP